MRIVVPEPHCSDNRRGVSDKPHICPVVRRARFAGDHSARSPVADCMTCSIVDNSTKHRCQLICVTWIDDALERCCLPGPELVAILRLDALYQTRPHAKPAICKRCV